MPNENPGPTSDSSVHRQFLLNMWLGINLITLLGRSFSAEATQHISDLHFQQNDLLHLVEYVPLEM
jgi:hypothetical protein